jgi:hypothetical protein
VEALARQLEIETKAIAVLSFTEMEWSDACLGLGGAAEICAAVITPGWEVLLGAGDRVYEVRTDAGGGHVRVAGDVTGRPGSMPDPVLEGAVIFFQRSGGIAGEVMTVRINGDGTVERSRDGLELGAPVELAVTDPAAVEALLEDLASVGYFELERSYLPEETCCDRILYLVSVEGAEGQHTVEALADAEETPPALLKSVEFIEAFVSDAFVR